MQTPETTARPPSCGISSRAALPLVIAALVAEPVGVAWGNAGNDPAGRPAVEHVAAVPRSGATAIDGPEVRVDLPYSPGALQKSDPLHALDLYLPSRAAYAAVSPAHSSPPPLFVYIHGGAWITGDKRQYHALGRALAGSGVAVAVINYRLSNDGATHHPAHALDAAQAISWLWRHAGQMGFDASRIYVGGHSAGAHIGALLASQPSLFAAVGAQPAMVRGYVGIEGIYDVPSLSRRFPSYRAEFLQAAFGHDEVAWKAASPTHLPMAPGTRWLLIHSSQDELVDAEQSRHFHASLTRNHAAARLMLLPRGSHFGVLNDLFSPETSLFRALIEFMRS